jgi:DUF4097 and DUF4098 domain-containing protein YvlB
MSNESNEAKESLKDSKARRGQSPWQRTETFQAPSPVGVNITTRSGDIAVHATEGDKLEVTLSADSSKYQDLLESAQISFDADTNELIIRTQSENPLGSSRSFVKLGKKSWFDFGGSDLDVFVVLPLGSSVSTKTMSGDVSILGAVGDVYVSSISADVQVSDSCESLEVKTTSGDVNVARVRRSLKCRTVSGDVTCLDTAATTDVNNASGDITLSASQPGVINVKSVSGDVKVRVARGLVVDVDGNSFSGDLGTNIDLDASVDASSDEEVITIKISTVSGDILVNKAS